ncbi:MAG TPA: hypothetical protein DDZ88_04595 [Verrucomicrobiales bacterium]|nr:hypothetical protein [Verrucomicrobiales bacterium]
MKEPAVRIVDLSADGLAEELEVDVLREGFVHELTVTCARSTENERPAPQAVHFTLNKIPTRP